MPDLVSIILNCVFTLIMVNMLYTMVQATIVDLRRRIEYLEHERQRLQAIINNVLKEDGGNAH